MNKKLKDQSGISMVYATFALMLVAIVSAVIINAALTGLNRNHNARASEQASLTVNSAAAFVRDSLTGDVISYTLTRTTTNIYKKDGGNWVLQSSDEQLSSSAFSYTEATGKPDNPVKALITDWVQKSFNGTFSAEGIMRERMLFNATLGEKTLDTVSADFEMDEDRNLRIVFCLAGDVANNYYLTMLLPCDAVSADASPVNMPSDAQTDTTRTVVLEQNILYSVDWDIEDICIVKGNISK